MTPTIANLKSSLNEAKSRFNFKKALSWVKSRDPGFEENVFKNCIDSILDYALDIAERRIEQSRNVGDIILIGGENIVLTVQEIRKDDFFTTLSIRCL